MCVSIAPPVPPEVRMSPHHAGMGSAGSGRRFECWKQKGTHRGVNGLIEANQTNMRRGPEHGRWGGNPTAPDLVIRWGPPIGGRGALPRIDLNERGTSESEGFYLFGAFPTFETSRDFLLCHKQYPPRSVCRAGR